MKLVILIAVGNDRLAIARDVFPETLPAARSLVAYIYTCCLGGRGSRPHPCPYPLAGLQMLLDLLQARGPATRQLFSRFAPPKREELSIDPRVDRTIILYRRPFHSIISSNRIWAQAASRLRISQHPGPLLRNRTFQNLILRLVARPLPQLFHQALPMVGRVVKNRTGPVMVSRLGAGFPPRRPGLVRRSRGARGSRQIDPTAVACVPARRLRSSHVRI